MEKTAVSASGLQFTVVIEPDVEDGGYVVHCPVLRGCWSQGESVDEALANITDAIIGWLSVSVEKTMAETRAQVSQRETALPMSIPVQVAYG